MCAIVKTSKNRNKRAANRVLLLGYRHRNSLLPSATVRAESRIKLSTGNMMASEEKAGKRKPEGSLRLLSSSGARIGQSVGANYELCCEKW